MTVQAPATPRPLPQLVSELRNDLKFWLHSSRMPGMLLGFVQSGTPRQETQSDRDARVARIQAIPGDVTLGRADRAFFGAIAYDIQGQQVGGVLFSWRAEDDTTKQSVKISQTGEFLPPAPGTYNITVEGASRTATLKATVLDMPSRPKPELSDEPGPGWDAGNFGAAEDPDNDRGDPPGRPLHHGAGSGNFQISAPVLALAGRGIDLSLALTYNSRLWTKSNSDITYDIDRDWPAPGWSLGFGRVAGLGSGGAMLIDADGTRHGFDGQVTHRTDGYYDFVGHTTDGTFIDYSSLSDPSGTIELATAKFPNGTVISYYNVGRGAVYPYRIVDANGNYISIHYRVSGANEIGPKIRYITDTLGRTINFYYEGGKLTAITQPGLDGERQLVRLHYKALSLSYGFSSTLTPHVDNATPDVLDAIYYPGTGTGYWFGDSDSYSSYGMLAKYSEQRGMGFSAASLTTQGTVTQGTLTRQYTYNYPMTANNTLTDAPTYTALTETWDGMDTSNAAVTTYLLEKNATTRSTTIIYPDQTKSVQLAYKAPGQYNDGYVYEDDTYDSVGTLLRKSTVTWAQGDYGSARPVRIEATDERSQKTAAEFDYELGRYNQVVKVRDYDYGGTSVSRVTVLQYRNSTDYTLNPHIFNVVKRVEVWNAGETVRLSRADYFHDVGTLSATPDVVQHDDTAVNGFRGNVTSVTRYADASKTTGGEGPQPTLAGGITETRTYDITGNMVTATTSCCEQTSLGYRLDTQYAFPYSKTRGAADETSPARLTTFAAYDFNTGLVSSTTDANGRSSVSEYYSDTLRPKTLTLPSGGYSSYAYDDVAMTVTETVYKDASTVASQNVKSLNGLGQVKNEAAMGQNSAWDYVDTKYDVMGRVWKQSPPYRSGQTQQWSETSYDALGRAYLVTAADGSQSRAYFNETTRPSSASSTAGQTSRVVDAWGRERWARLDADGRLVEVVEPNPSGNGTVTAAGNMVTTYVYDTLGNLTQVNQGSQQRKFRYDSLNRLTYQKLAEESATLNDLGQYVGTTGSWGEAFAYDERSNLVAQTDARGVKTIYSYNSDPLNRLQSVTYDTSGFGDTTHPILAAAGVSYEYMSTGDKTRLYKVTTAGASTDEYGYDTEGRLSTRTLTLTSRSIYPMVTSYIYDSLNRVSDISYPVQYGVGGNPRKVVHQDYDTASRLSGLTVDGASYASDIIYNAASQTTSLKVGASGANQITESYTYEDLTGLLTDQKVQRGTTSLMDLSYDYLRTGTASGRTGQVTRIINHLDRGKDRGYEYDALGRLAKATGGQYKSWTQTYSYDRYGNRTGVTASGYSASNSAPREGLPTDQLLAANLGDAGPKSLRADPSAIVSDARAALGLSAAGQSLSPQSLATTQPRAVFDEEPDGKSDISYYRAGVWSIQRSSNPNNARFIGWGGSGSTLAYGDFDGDGKIDPACIIPESGQVNAVYAILQSSLDYSYDHSMFVSAGFPSAGDEVVVGDFDGDGKADPSTFRASQGAWKLQKSTANYSPTSITWGQSGDKPIVADFDADGISDIGFYRNGVWGILLSSQGYSANSPQWFSWGDTGLQPIVGDFDGDGKADIAYVAPPAGGQSATYAIRLSSRSYSFAPGQVLFVPAGYPSLGDTPVVGDWDGDGKSDPGIWRGSQGVWIIPTSSSNFSSYIFAQWGQSGDTPLPSRLNEYLVPRGQQTQGPAVPSDGLASVGYDAASNHISTAGWQYDAAGNQTRAQRADGSWQRYVYDAAGRLIKVQSDAGVTQLSQTYGASNQRLIEQVGDENSSQRTYYAWQGESVIAEYSESASNPSSLAWSKSYIYLGARLLATLAAGAASERVEYQHPDRLGTRLVTNNQDTTSFEQAALAYGTALDGESAGATKRRFTSYERSSVSGLDYGVNRHYDPLQGRFTQVDPIGMRSTSLADPQTLNLYAYCANDPVNRIDPNGLGFFGFLGSLFKGIGKVLGVVATVAKWVTFAVAATVAVLVVAAVVFSAPWAAAALQWLAPLMGKLIFSAAEGGAGVSAGEVAGGLVAAGSVNNFIAKKRGNRRTSRRKIVRQAIGVALSAAEILQLIHDNNQARAYGADDATVFCQTYKESMFKPMARAGSHRGLLEVNPVAAKEAGLGNGQATPAKNPIYFNNIFDPAQNIRTGTSYLAIRIQRAGDDLTRGLEGFGTGSGYADNILDCAALVNGGIAIGSVEPGLGAIMFWVGLRKIYP